jgi:hypothetical protein
MKFRFSFSGFKKPKLGNYAFPGLYLHMGNSFLKLCYIFMKLNGVLEMKEVVWTNAGI